MVTAGLPLRYARAGEVEDKIDKEE